VSSVPAPSSRARHVTGPEAQRGQPQTNTGCGHLLCVAGPGARRAGLHHTGARGSIGGSGANPPLLGIHFAAGEPIPGSGEVPNRTARAVYRGAGRPSSRTDPTSRRRCSGPGRHFGRCGPRPHHQTESSPPVFHHGLIWRPVCQASPTRTRLPSGGLPRRAPASGLASGRRPAPEPPQRWRWRSSHSGLPPREGAIPPDCHLEGRCSARRGRRRPVLSGPEATERPPITAIAASQPSKSPAARFIPAQLACLNEAASFSCPLARSPLGSSKRPHLISSHEGHGDVGQ
jgi:hypothetical protein